MLSRRQPPTSFRDLRVNTRARETFVAVIVALVLAAVPQLTFARATVTNASDKDTVWNYDTGIFFATDGSIRHGPCFRVTGKVTAPAFFDHPKHVTVFAEQGYPIVLAPIFFNGLKRIDHADQDSVFRRGSETLTKYPNELLMQFVMHDLPCSLELKDAPNGKVLTREMVDSLRFSLWWKDGVELHPVHDTKVLKVMLRPMVPPEVLAERGIPQIYEWAFSLLVPSAEVPLTDSLVLMIRTADGRIAARVAARM